MDKTKVKELLHGAADKSADAANKKAAAASGWQKWLWAAAAVIAGAIAWFTQAGCTNVTSAQLSAAHALYHAVTGEPCTLAQPERVTESK